MRVIGVIGIAAMIGIAACGQTAAPTPSPLATVAITAPKDGQTVPAGDVTVSYDVKGVLLVPAASAQKPEDYHVHVLLDVDPSTYVGKDVAVPAASANPDPARIIHTAAYSVTFKDVKAGDHSVTVFMTFSTHISVKPPVSASVKFTAR